MSFTSWLQLPSAVILEPKNIKSLTISIVSPSICHEVMGLDAMISGFWVLSFKPTFSLSTFTFIKRLFSSLSLSAKRLVSSEYLRLLRFLQAVLKCFILCFIQPSILHDVLCKKLNKHGDHIQPWCTPFPIWNQSVVPCPVLTASCSPGGSEVKACASSAGDPGSFPGLGRSSREGNGNPLQYSCLDNPMDRGAW